MWSLCETWWPRLGFTLSFTFKQSNVSKSSQNRAWGRRDKPDIKWLIGMGLQSTGSKTYSFLSLWLCIYANGTTPGSRNTGTPGTAHRAFLVLTGTIPDPQRSLEAMKPLFKVTGGLKGWLFPEIRWLICSLLGRFQETREQGNDGDPFPALPTIIHTLEGRTPRAPAWRRTFLERSLSLCLLQVLSGGYWLPSFTRFTEQTE